MVEKSAIRLRGHHLDVIAIHYLKGLESRTERAKAILYNSLFNGPQIALKARSIVDSMESDLNLQVQIIGGLDDICLHECPRKEESCNRIEDDEVTLDGYGLECGRIYSSGELLEVIRIYKEKTGSDSPRKRLLERVAKAYLEKRLMEENKR
ncbi:hypothetical protein HZA33_04780 [Candidatus Pacearchaeota archaeon]|nr:hypothetical protein [Candidatus Pacearchaeota archaeon]